MQRLDTRDEDFGARFHELAEARRESDADVSNAVRAILDDVRTRGDEALTELTRRFDGFDLAESGFVVQASEFDEAERAVSDDVKAAMQLAAGRIREFHEAQRPKDHEQVDEVGTRTGWRYRPIEAAGIYVPGGRAPLFSSALMNGLPARAAGVERLVMATPATGGRIDPHVLYAARLAGIETVYRIGGAQAIAALAYGTQNIPAVDMIAGPGNAYVAEAKRQLYGRVGIDMVAGPSEILVVADSGADPDVLAADLLSQAEHDPTSQSILITDDAELAEAVESVLPEALAAISTGETARTSWEANGAIIIVGDLSEVPALVNRLAPEHLALAVQEPAPLFAKIDHAGSVFFGYLTPEAVGDYVAGPNHVLPTGRRARFSSGLGTLDFMKRSTFLHVSEAGFAELGPAAAALAHAEQLPAHALSIERRLGKRRG